MTNEHSFRLVDILSRILRGEPGSGRELQNLKVLAWSDGDDGRLHLMSGPLEAYGMLAVREGKVVRAWFHGTDFGDSTVGQPVREAKEAVTDYFDARGYVVLP